MGRVSVPLALEKRVPLCCQVLQLLSKVYDKDEHRRCIISGMNTARYAIFLYRNVNIRNLFQTYLLESFVTESANGASMYVWMRSIIFGYCLFFLLPLMTA